MDTVVTLTATHPTGAHVDLTILPGGGWHGRGDASTVDLDTAMHRAILAAQRGDGERARGLLEAAGFVCEVTS